MIIKILVNGKEYGIDISEDMGEVTIHDTFHCDAKIDGSDTIFGTEDPMVTIEIKGDDTMDPQCKHACTNCAGYETTGDCNHGCDDCSHFDGENCINAESNYYGCTGGIPAANCHVWNKEIKGADIMNEFEVKTTLLTAAIENEFGPLNWADITVYEEGTGSITFTGPTLSERDWTPGAFRGAEDAFFAKIRRIKEMIKNCGYTAEMIKFEADCDCPYSEATININFTGGEL